MPIKFSTHEGLSQRGVITVFPGTRTVVIAVVLLTLFLLESRLPADEIVLSNGKTIEGTVIQEFPDSVKFKMGSSTVSFPRSRISSISKDERPEQGPVVEEQREESLLRSGRYAEAYLLLTDEGIPLSPERLDLLRQTISRWDSDLAAGYRNVSKVALKSEIERLEREVSPAMPEPKRTDISRRLAHARMALAGKGMVYISRKDAIEQLERARESVRDIKGLNLLLVNLLPPAERQAKGYGILKTSMALHPDDTGIIDWALECGWQNDPWTMLSVVCPNGVTRPAATEKMKESSPDVILACFNHKPYPSNAPFDRMECYEHYMDMRPDADPGVWVALKIEAGHPLARPVVRWAEWSERQGDLLGAVLAYDAGESQLDASGISPTYAGKIGNVYEQQKVNWQRELAHQLTRHDYEAAHVIALRILTVYPDQTETARAVRELTAVRDACRQCDRGRVTCRNCGGDGKCTEFRSVTCMNCEGGGAFILYPTVGCSHCGGDGQDASKGEWSKLGKMDTNGDGELSYEELERGHRCDMCGGSGRIRISGEGKRIPCEDCKATGKVRVPIEVRCDTCRGSGKVTCPTCRGALYNLRQSPRPPTIARTSLPSMPAWLLALGSDSKRFGHLNGKLQEIAQLRDITVPVPDYPQSVVRTATSKVRQPGVLKNVGSPYDY